MYPDYPHWSQSLLQSYWFVRNARFDRDRRKAYRRVRRERLSLIDQGHDPEAVRLLCLSMCRPQCPHRWERFKRYVKRDSWIQLSLLL